jgi:hypothetical protein
LCGEAVSTSLESRAEFPEIINFTVEDNRDAARLIEDRLMAGGEIDDAEAAVPQAYRSIDEYSLLVWSAMPQAGTHAPEADLINLL